MNISKIIGNFTYSRYYIVLQNNQTDLFALIWSGHEVALKRWLIVSSLLCISGTILNVLILAVLITLSRSGQHRSSCHWQVTHLIVIDLIQCAVTLPLDMLVSRFPRFFTPLECTFQRVPFITLECAGHWAACLVALNRFIALVLPTHYQKLCGHEWSDLGSIVGSWVIGLLLNIPYITGFGGSSTLSPDNFNLIYSSGFNIVL